MFDHYKARIKHAFWTWLEAKRGPFGGLRRKDRASGRVEKHRARALVKREIREENDR